MTVQENKKFFEEKILYKTRQHWIIPCLNTIKYIVFLGIPITLCTYFITNYSWIWMLGIFFGMSGIIGGYIYYLWFHSWLMIGNQKITMTIRNGFFSQYAMNIRYRNIRDCAVSKSSMLGFICKYGSLFIRSSGAEGDFEAKYVPKAGKIYALINALSRYDDDDRTDISTIEELHNHHHKKEFLNVDESVDRHG